MKTIKLNEDSILQRLSDGELGILKGGIECSPTGPMGISNAQNSLCTCVAGCGCSAHSACVTCTA